MRIRLRNPDREVELAGPRRVHDVLAELEIDPDTVLVIRDRTLLTREERLEEADEIEIRPVMTIAGLPSEIAVLIIEHDMDLVFRFASRITVLVSGAVYAEGTPPQIAANREVRAVYLGGALDA